MRWLSLATLIALSGFAAERKPITGKGANEKVGIDALAVIDRAEVKQLLGSDFGGSIVAIEVTITPKGAKALALSKDDFTLRAYNDGQKSKPFAPSQIAGRGALVVTTTGGRGAIMGNESGPTYGGMGGGMPGRLGGNGGGFGNGADTIGTREATMQDSNKEKDNPLLDALRKKEMPEKETAEPVKGLLYFPLEGKHKAKDLALVYEGPAGKMIIEFRQ